MIYTLQVQELPVQVSMCIHVPLLVHIFRLNVPLARIRLSEISILFKSCMALCLVFRPSVVSRRSGSF